MAIADIRIHDPLWDDASELRRAEWRTLIVDLLDEAALFEGRPATVLHLEPSVGETTNVEPAGVMLRTDDPDFHPVEVWDETLARHFDEYLGTIRQLMDENLHPMRREAIDMAKKVVHDHAARRLAERLPELSRSHEAHRRLFSLLVSLRTDTTKLPASHRHTLR